MEGTVKWYNDMKSFGFIEIEEGNDVFVHKSAIPEGIMLREGDKVEFDIEDTERGKQATNIKKL